MKTTLFFLSFCLFTGIVNAQTIHSREIPPTVLSSYLSQHAAGIHDSLWTTEVDTIYKVRYRDGDKIFEAQYAEDGSWIKTFAETPKEELLTAAIQSKIDELYPNHKVVKSYVELDNEGKFYVLDLQKEKDLLTVYFTPSGHFYK